MNPKARQESPAMSKAAQKIREALLEALHGEVITHTVAPFSPAIDVRSIREQLGMNRDEFAKAFHFSKYSVRNWEIGKRTPNGATLAFLKVIQTDPLDAYRKLHFNS